MTLAEAVREAHRTAQEKGWWDQYKRGARVTYALTPTELASKLALIHSEVSEALEAVREGRIYPTRRKDGKPEGFPSELADICIRVFDLAGAMGIYLEKEIEAKMAYNKTRPFRHGGKQI